MRASSGPREMLRERTLERAHYRSIAEVLERYGVPAGRLERWRAQSEPPFPDPVEVRWQDDLFFHLLGLVRWETSFQRRRGVMQ